MKILLLGSGGREHAFAWKIHQSPLCTNLFIAPGNAGTQEYGRNIQLDLLDFKSIGKFCRKEKIDLLIVGPEEPLVKGIYDFFQNDSALKNIMVIGPSAEAAKLEGSKAFAKAFMIRHGIPTANYREFDKESYTDGLHYIRQHPLPVVLKADGLAAGKGVLICTNHVEAMGEFELMIQDEKFGEAGRKVVVEEFLHGIELSVFVLTDGEHYLILPQAKDYKRIGKGDSGLNTGGMGAISPVPFADVDFVKKIEEQIIKPTIQGIKEENLKYKGFVFVGIINVNGEPVVIEYNCRMGDPETEVVLPRLKNDLLELFIATSRGRLNEITIEEDERSAATIVAVSGGYPGEFKKGMTIDFGYKFNPEALKAVHEDHTTMIFHAGTRPENDEVLTSGGRVLAVTSYGNTITDAVEKSKEMLEQIYFEDMYYRSDIGFEFT